MSRGAPGQQRRSIEERFWPLVDVLGVDDCWPWLGMTDADRYGRFKVVAFRSSTVREQAHRVAKRLSGSEVRPDSVVMHTCDNPPCCNPKHLRVATHDDNQKDKAAKGRAASGDDNGARRGRRRANSKLRRSDVDEILSSGETANVLARRYGVTRWAIYKVRSRATWA